MREDTTTTVRSKQTRKGQKHYQTKEIPPPIQRTPLADLLGDYHFHLLLFLARHRRARTNHLHHATGGNIDTLRRELRYLFDLGAVAKEREPFEPDPSLRPKGSRPKIYKLTRKGASAVATYLDVPVQRITWPDNQRGGGYDFKPHALQRTDFLAPLEAACLCHHSISYTDAVTIVQHAPDTAQQRSNPYRWDVEIDAATYGITPDKIFALTMPRVSTTTLRQTPPAALAMKDALFFLEVDMGDKSMPVERTDFLHNPQSSGAKKIVLYGMTHRQKLHEALYGFSNFRVLFLTDTAKRITHFLKVVERLSLEYGFPSSLFLFAEHGAFTPDNVLTAPWRLFRRRTMRHVLAEEGGGTPIIGQEETQCLID